MAAKSGQFTAGKTGKGQFLRGTGPARRILLFHPAQVRGQEKAVTMASKSGQFPADETGKGQFLRGN